MTRRGDEAGFTLVELLVAVVVLAVMLTMLFVSGTAVFTQEGGQVRTATSISRARLAVETISSYLRNAVDPYADATASGGTLGDSGPCWGTHAPEVPPGASSTAVAKPENVAIVWAHDFDLWVCSLPPGPTSTVGTTAPHTYRIWLDPSTCRDSGPSQPGNCTVEIDDYGTGDSCVSTTCARTVWSVPHVVCDASCRNDPNNGSEHLTQSPLFAYYHTAALTGSAAEPLDDASAADARDLPAIHDVVVTLSLVTGNPARPQPTTDPPSTASASVFLPSTVAGD